MSPLTLTASAADMTDRVPAALKAANAKRASDAEAAAYASASGAVHGARLNERDLERLAPFVEQNPAQEPGIRRVYALAAPLTEAPQEPPPYPATGVGTLYEGDLLMPETFAGWDVKRARKRDAEEERISAVLHGNREAVRRPTEEERTEVEVSEGLAEAGLL